MRSALQFGFGAEIRERQERLDDAGGASIAERGHHRAGQGVDAAHSDRHQRDAPALGIARAQLFGENRELLCAQRLVVSSRDLAGRGLEGWPTALLIPLDPLLDRGQRHLIVAMQLEPRSAAFEMLTRDCLMKPGVALFSEHKAG